MTSLEALRGAPGPAGRDHAEAVRFVADRLSLRAPQRHALEVLERLVRDLPLRKSRQMGVDSALALVRAALQDAPQAPGVATDLESFERAFPSLCFALATGVGKTRLMGAFMAFLHAAHGIEHFFVLAPSTTIYEKLKADFHPVAPKYVFKGLGELVRNGPRLITGDDFEERRVDSNPELFGAPFDISVFNRQKLGGDQRRRIRRLSEVIGTSYFDYLAGLDDLVILMDESHRYRSDNAVELLDELRPVMGLEVTATPFVERQRGTIHFKNVAYYYPLSAAMADGLVKEPAVATRENFDASGVSAEQLERIKLEDGATLHERVKAELAAYCARHARARVKPFMLVIAAGTAHANALASLMESDEFCAGRYKGRVITVHSNVTGAKRDEYERRLIAVESPDEPTEIVVHVDKLKEGWDVTNLYTIVPLRAASSRVLIEQSIGRGVRLPFGARTGVPELDRLTIVAHDRFDEVLAEAKRPDSIIRQAIRIGVDVPAGETALVQVAPTFVGALLPTGTPPGEPVVTVDFPAGGGDLVAPALHAIRVIACDPARAPTLAALATPAGREAVLLELSRQAHLSVHETAGPLFQQVTDAVVDACVRNTIGIPRIVVVPRGEVASWFEPFDLDVSQLPDLLPVDVAILVRELRDQGISEVLAAERALRESTPERDLLFALVDLDDVDYARDGDLLDRLARQACDCLRERFGGVEESVRNVVLMYRRILVDVIHSQLRLHYRKKHGDLVAQVHQGFVPLESVVYTQTGAVRPFRDEVSDKRSIRNYVFGGFRKCLYPQQKFDSDAERRMAALLEDDADIRKWFKPARMVFRIDWSDDEPYEPDFVAETDELKLMIEVKRSDQVKQEVVERKAKAAMLWCGHATAHETQHGGKPWHYLLVPDSEIHASWTASYLMQHFEQCQTERPAGEGRVAAAKARRCT